MRHRGARDTRPGTLRIVFPCLALCLSLALHGEVKPVVEVEEDLYTYTEAENGAGPMWCYGSTCLVRVGERLFASGLETLPGIKPLNNCRWMLFERQKSGWEKVWVDEQGRTREPAPLAAFADGRVFVSANPVKNTSAEAPLYGPAEPVIFQFQAAHADQAPQALRPEWQGTPAFTEHSYRSFAADGPSGEMILFQNIGYTHSEWAFRDADGKWAATGQLKWPWGAEYDEPQPVRLCYPNVAIKDRAVWFFGVSDILEPYAKWRDYKRQLTGQEWDYDFRRLFFTWTPDITSRPFHAWVEIASRDKTGGWMMPGDLYVAENGDVHLTWTERAIDERLRKEFFPETKQSHLLCHAVVRKGRMVSRELVEESTEDKPGIVAAWPRFQAAPGGRLFLFYYAAGVGPEARRVEENRVREIGADGKLGPAARVPFERPFVSHFTASVRAGSPPSRTLELLGNRAGSPHVISYARVRLD